MAVFDLRDLYGTKVPVQVSLCSQDNAGFTPLLEVQNRVFVHHFTVYFEVQNRVFGHLFGLQIGCQGSLFGQKIHYFLGQNTPF